MPGAYAGLITHERKLSCLERTFEKTTSRTRARHLTQDKIIITVLQKYGRKTANLEKDYLRRVKEIPPPKEKESYGLITDAKKMYLIPASLEIKSPLKTAKGIKTVRQTSRKLVIVRINDCHKRKSRYS